MCQKVLYWLLCIDHILCFYHELKLRKWGVLYQVISISCILDLYLLTCYKLTCECCIYPNTHYQKMGRKLHAECLVIIRLQGSLTLDPMQEANESNVSFHLKLGGTGNTILVSIFITILRYTISLVPKPLLPCTLTQSSAHHLLTVRLD